MTKCDSIDDVMDEIRKASRADDKGDWSERIMLDVTNCFDPHDIITFDTGHFLLMNQDCIPIKGEVCDGDQFGEYALTNLIVNKSRFIAFYYTYRNGSEQAAYAPGARR